MASVVSNRRGGWEIRESHSTPNGPRSRTLASFRVLDGGVLDHAESRAEKNFDRVTVVRSARRAGAEVAAAGAESAARALLTALARGESISPGLAGALKGRLEEAAPPKLSPEAMAASEWAGVSMREHGATLHDLLLMTDALPQKRYAPATEFPRLGAA
jgi:hypothetical protein